ncbi:N-acetylated-alpha-linked acidic dipeptidase 2-like [Mya arenaria]|uniref:N-acetylated-alpha-linked acidic dipeptidase 2-like n=1 Tax=Mya arenaria TaxID=6604 RepID=UPI0022DF0BED|nr:N-acetylated-alpha-linked acidic dipeptidase 2-like [Mya arenaria]
MGFGDSSQGFDVIAEDGSSGKYKNGNDRKVYLLAAFAICVAFVVGLLIGHYAIKKTTDGSADVADGGSTLPVVGGTTTAPTQPSPTACSSAAPQVTSQLPSTMVTDADTTGAPETPTQPPSAATTTERPSGVFLEGVSEAIIREADPTITDIILNEINATNIRENLRGLIESPHVAGTERDLEQADGLKEFWLENGMDAAYTTPYTVLLSYPSDTQPNMMRLYSGDATILETDENETNLTSEERPWEFPFPYHGYSGNGTVQADVVYVNYARAEDFVMLKSMGVNVSGKIVLCRYGMGGRSGKASRAEEHGAVGVIMYSDPADYVAAWATDAYPDSIWIPETATSRGSIFSGTGDPLTPGYPSIDSAFRYGETDDEVGLPGIPSMPVSYAFAEKLLRHLGGEAAPESWRGRLNATYTLGGTFVEENVTAELSVHTYNEQRVTYNAFGVIHGETEPDRYVLLGNHRDSWVLGAIDPTSGTATMMELSRVLGNLVKQGVWRPRRTIIFCSWGAEEFALIGSTEWIEENSKTLDFRTIAYINMDIAVTGNYSIRGLGSAPVFSAMYRAAQKVPSPNADDGTTVFEEWVARKPVRDPASGTDLGIPQINSPGEGSDYATFMQRAGITCADFRYDEDFAGDGVLFYPLYHTSYETLHAVEHLIDPGFKLHAAIGKLSGELLRDLADSKILPFNMTDYTMYLQHFVQVFKTNASNETTTYNLNITELDRVISLYDEEANKFHSAVETDINPNNPLDVRRVNDQMMQIERAFLDPASLPGRNHLYRHLIHSGTHHSVFPSKSFPGLEDAIFHVRLQKNEENIRALQHHFSVLVFTIQGAANSLRNATAFLRETS